MVRVCEGTKSKTDMLEEAIVQYKEMYIIAKREFNKVVTVRQYRLNYQVQEMMMNRVCGDI